MFAWESRRIGGKYVRNKRKEKVWFGLWVKGRGLGSAEMSQGGGMRYGNWSFFWDIYCRIFLLRILWVLRHYLPPLFPIFLKAEIDLFYEAVDRGPVSLQGLFVWPPLIVCTRGRFGLVFWGVVHLLAAPSFFRAAWSASCGLKAMWRTIWA